MAIQTDFEPGYTPDKFNTPAVGRFHAVVVLAEEDGIGKSTDMILDYEVLAGSTPKQEGTVFRDYFGKKSSQMGRIHQIAIALGFVTSDELKKLIEAKTPPEYDFNGKAKGCHFFVELQEEEYNGNTNLKSGFRLYPIDSAKCVNWPRNLAALKAAGYSVDQDDSAKEKPKTSIDSLLDGVA